MAPFDNEARVPDFFIAGHPKTGTTALHGALQHHPQLFLPAYKEPGFLAADLRPLFQPSGWWPLIDTRQQYLALFEPARPDQVAGEASSNYLFSEVAAGAVADLNPAAKVIAIFREPTSFLRSLHLQLLQNHNEDVVDLSRCLELEPERAAGRSLPKGCYGPRELRYTEHLRYTEQLRRYHQVLPKDQVLVLVYDDYRQDHERTVRRILQFLGVDDSVPLASAEANPTVALRSRRLDDVVRRFAIGRGPLSRAVKSAITSVVPRQTRRHWRDKVVYVSPEPEDAELTARLKARFRPEVERFSEYLGRDLVSLWGYDAIVLT